MSTQDHKWLGLLCDFPALPLVKDEFDSADATDLGARFRKGALDLKPGVNLPLGNVFVSSAMKILGYAHVTRCLTFQSNF